MNTEGIKFYNLRQLTENIWQVDKNTDLVYSRDDEERYKKGWYLQKYPGGVCSQLFETDTQAISSLKKGNVKFPEVK